MKYVIAFEIEIILDPQLTRENRIVRVSLIVIS